LECYKLPGDRVLVVVEGDITKASVDAIVNAANSLMIMGGGVAGAIKRAGGEEIEREAMKRAPVPVGEAIATGAGRLKARYVIHAPTMERPAMSIPLENAVKATRAALKKAVELGVESVALPAMGAGVGGLRVRDVAREMARVAREVGPRLIVFVAYGRDAYEEMRAGVREVLGEPVECPAGLKVFP
jgi:O-acetyl-ADP-ribose deacetylase (regulator of RNase III)